MVSTGTWFLSRWDWDWFSYMDGGFREWYADSSARVLIFLFPVRCHCFLVILGSTLKWVREALGKGTVELGLEFSPDSDRGSAFVFEWTNSAIRFRSGRGLVRTVTLLDVWLSMTLDLLSLLQKAIRRSEHHDAKDFFHVRVTSDYTFFFYF